MPGYRPALDGLGNDRAAAHRRGAGRRLAGARAPDRRGVAPGCRTGGRRRLAVAGHDAGVCRALQRHGRGSAGRVFCGPGGDISQCLRPRGRPPKRPRVLALALRRSGDSLPHAPAHRSSYFGDGRCRPRIDLAGRVGRVFYRRSGQRRHAADGDRGGVRPGALPGFRRSQPRSLRALSAGVAGARATPGAEVDRDRAGREQPRTSAEHWLAAGKSGVPGRGCRPAFGARGSRGGTRPGRTARHGMGHPGRADIPRAIPPHHHARAKSRPAANHLEQHEFLGSATRRPYAHDLVRRELSTPLPVRPARGALRHRRGAAADFRSGCGPCLRQLEHAGQDPSRGAGP